MADEAFEAAVAMLSKGTAAPVPEAPAPEPAPAPSPAPEAPAEPAPETPAAPAATPAPALEDAEAKLRADLEARRVQRQQRQQQVDPNVAAMQAKIEALEARLTAPQQANLQALIAEHGELEALRKLGVDPLQFFDGFRKHAQKEPAVSKAERTAAEAKQIAEANQKRLDEQQAAEQQRQQREQMSAVEKLYLESTSAPEWEADPGLKLEHLHKLPAQQRLEWTHKTIAHWRDGEGVDISHLTDRQLAKLTDMHFRDEVARHLTGTEAGSTTPQTMPTTDGAKTKQQPAASLTNAVASQVSGRERPMTDEELFAASVRVLENRQ